ncbi:MAG: hypothetical protein AADX98_20885 [Thiocapsa sp. C3-3m]
MKNGRLVETRWIQPKAVRDSPNQIVRLHLSALDPNRQEPRLGQLGKQIVDQHGLASPGTTGDEHKSLAMFQRVLEVCAGLCEAAVLKTKPSVRRQPERFLREAVEIFIHHVE